MSGTPWITGPVWFQCLMIFLSAFGATKAAEMVWDLVVALRRLHPPDRERGEQEARRGG